MRRVPPSTVIREELYRLLAGGVDEERNVVSDVLKLALRSVVQQALEQEQTDFLGRGHYERATERRGHRNGYEDATLRTAEGGVEVRTPQVRSSAAPFRPKLLDFLDGNSSALERLVVEMYARGLSTRDVEDTFRDPVTGELLISRSAVSEITDALWEEYEAFCSRDLEDFDVCYLFLDAIYESLRRHGAKEGVLVAWGICPDGRKVRLHMAVGNKESEECWTEFLRNMQARGLRPPISVTSDGAPGLVNAVGTCLPRSIRIRCWYHRLGNIRAKLPDDGAAEVMAWLRSVRDAPSHPAGQRLAAEVIQRFSSDYPAWPASKTTSTRSWATCDCPLGTASRCARPTSPSEASSRSAGAPRSSRGCSTSARLKLVFATLIRCSQRWSRVSINDLERQQLRVLRVELKLDPPPPTRERTPKKRSRRRAA